MSRCDSRTTPAARPVGVGPEVLHVGDEEQRLEQVVDAVAVEGGHGEHLDVAAPVLRDEAVLGELLLHAVGLAPARGPSC